MFSDEIHDAFRAHAVAEFPKEAVGLVVERDMQRFYMPLVNTHPEPTKAFRFDGKHYAIASEEGVVLAVLHSHTPFEDTNAQGEIIFTVSECPSKQDMELQLQLEVPFGIGICATHDRCGVPFYFGDQLPIAPLVGRKYMYNVRYCYSLVRDYYRTREVNPFTMEQVASSNHWWDAKEDNPNYLEKGLEASGFKIIPASEVRVGDAFMARIRAPVINHVGVLVEPQLVLHHLQNQLSAREPVARVVNFIVHWVRHEKDF